MAAENETESVEDLCLDTVNTDNPESEYSFMNWGHSQIVRTDSTQSTKSSSTASETMEEAVRLELECYEKDRYLEPEQKPHPWWEYTKARYPLIFPLASKLMTIPPSSVESERIFSIGTAIYSPKRNSLKPSSSERLMFLNYNLRYLKHIYEFDLAAYSDLLTNLNK